MKHTSVIILLFITFFMAEKSYARVTVYPDDAGTPTLWYTDITNMLGATPLYPECVRTGDSAYFDIPDDGKTYYARLIFDFDKMQTQSPILILLPGEKIAVWAEMDGDYLKYEVGGSGIMAAETAHRQAGYIQYEKELVDTGFSPCGDNSGNNDKIMEIIEKIRAAKIDYILANPDSPLSAWYIFSAARTPDHGMELYGKISDGVRNGPCKDMLQGILNVFNIYKTKEQAQQ